MTATSHSNTPPREVEGWHREAQRALNQRDYRRAHELCLRILQAAPQHADAMFLLGMIAAAHDNFAKASEVIQRAIAKDATHADYHAQLARCQIALNDPQQAMQSAQRALALQPQDALTLDTIGVVMARAGMHAESVEPFKRAVAIDPSKTAYHYNLGAALQFIGDFAAARTAYRHALTLDPANYRAWSSLAQVERKPFSAADIEHLQSLLVANAASGAVSDSVDAQLHLCHALAKHFEDAGQYAQSFAYLVQGKRRKRATQPYSIAADEALFATAREVCTPDFLAANAPGSDSDEAIFIVGMPRTGTTLVERILASHPEVFAAGELTNFALAIKRATGTPSKLVLDVDTLHAGQSLDWRRIGDTYIDSTRPRTGHTRHFIDKLPLNILYTGFIRRALPKAKIICVRRNPLDTCLSNFRQLFATQFPYYDYAYDLLDTGRYYASFDRLAGYWREQMPDNYCEIAYESVVADTESEARRLVAFCGLEWHPACLNFHENSAPVATASSVQVRQPIYRTSIARWRNYASEIAPLQELLKASGIDAADFTREV